MELVTSPLHPGARIVTFGECMVELSRTVLGGRSWALGCAGDCYNVAVYLARMRTDVAFMSALGTDSFSSEMRDTWTGEGLATELIVTHPDRIPGLYAIRVDDTGERSFTYWRENSAARAFFECPGAAAALHRAGSADVLYLSAITLSLFGPADRARIVALAETVRVNGGDVVFDTNYRPRAWRSPADARSAIEPVARCATILLPTFDDDHALYGDRDADACATRWLTTGVREVVVKLGPDGCLVAQNRSRDRVVPPRRIDPVDTTGAGDAFNAGYLAARVRGKDALESAETGNALAGVVVQHPGAIVPRVVMSAPLTAIAK